MKQISVFLLNTQLKQGDAVKADTCTATDLTATRNGDGEIVVVKAFDRSFIEQVQNRNSLVRVLREKHVMQTVARLPHPFLVSIRFSCIDPDCACIGMENVGGGDLYALLQRRGSFPALSCGPDAWCPAARGCDCRSRDDRLS